MLAFSSTFMLMFYSTHIRKHALSKSSSVSCTFGVWVEERGTLGLIHCQSEVFLLSVHLEMWTLLHRGIIIFSEEKTPLSWFKGRSNEMFYVLDQVYASMIWLCFWFVMWHLGSHVFFYHMILLYGKNTKCKAGKFALNFLFLISRCLIGCLDFLKSHLIQ